MDRSKVPVKLRDINPAVPQVLESVIHRSIETEKQKRFGKADTMLAAVRQIYSATLKLNESSETRS